MREREIVALQLKLLFYTYYYVRVRVHVVKKESKISQVSSNAIGRVHRGRVDRVLAVNWVGYGVRSSERVGVRGTVPLKGSGYGVWSFVRVPLSWALQS